MSTALGITPGKLPKFVRTFGDVGAAMRNGLDAYAREVRDRSFPAQEHTYAMPDAEWEAFASGAKLR